MNNLYEKPSQWLNFNKYFSLLFLMIHPFAAIFIFPYILWNILVIYFWKWDYTNDSITEIKGVFNITTHQIHYFRIKDVILIEPFFYRLVGLSKITLITSELSQPILEIKGIYNGKNKKELINKMVRDARKTRGVKEYDIR